MTGKRKVNKMKKIAPKAACFVNILRFLHKFGIGSDWSVRGNLRENKKTHGITAREIAVIIF